MNKITGLSEAFEEAKQVFLTTYDKNGEPSTRPMTNYNHSPYEPMWFASFLETRKVEEIKGNPEVVVSFPAEEVGKWYRVNGKAHLASWEEVRDNWKWWYLEWVPVEERDKYALHYDNPFTDRTIIWVKPYLFETGDTK